MRKISLLISFLFLSFGFVFNAYAQRPESYRLDLVESTNPPAYLLPTTAVQIKVVVKKETIKTGPYARFAQKYLGSIAPLTDKVTYSIKGATLGYKGPKNISFINHGVEADTKLKAISQISNREDFVKSLPDRTSITNRSLEDMARDAAMSIFSLRKRRMELVTGETGENVYGEGMKDAVREMLRMEHELLALFFGKQTEEDIVRIMEVVPKQGTTNYVAFRFSPSLGVLSESDLSGEPVVLMITPENKVSKFQGRYNKNSVFYQVPDWAECRLLDGTNELDVARIPIYQFGTTIAVEGNK